MITTVAGTGEAGYSGDHGPAAEARLDQPENIAVDRYGNLYIGDLRNHRIRRVDFRTGEITSVAGTGEAGYSGDGAPAVSAAISSPFGLVVDDRNGDLYFADTENQRIRKIDSATGIITTIAGNGRRGFGGDGGSATEAMLARPHVLAFHNGDLLIGDSFNQRIRRVDLPNGTIHTIAGTGEQGVSGDGGPASDATFVFFGELAVDERDRLFLSGVGNHTIRMIDLRTGIIERIAGTGRWDFGGDGGPALAAHFHLPYGLDLDAAGNVYVADFWNWRVRKIDIATGTVSTVAGGIAPPEGTEHYHFHFEGGN